MDETSPKCVSLHGIQHKKGLSFLGHSFMAILGHYWLKNGPLSALPAFGGRRIILNDTQSGSKCTQMYLYTW